MPYLVMHNILYLFADIFNQVFSWNYSVMVRLLYDNYLHTNISYRLVQLGELEYCARVTNSPKV